MSYLIKKNNALKYVLPKVTDLSISYQCPKTSIINDNECCYLCKILWLFFFCSSKTVRVGPQQIWRKLDSYVSASMWAHLCAADVCWAVSVQRSPNCAKTGKKKRESLNVTLLSTVTTLATCNVSARISVAHWACAEQAPSPPRAPRKRTRWTRDELGRIPAGGRCNFNHLFFLSFVMLSAIIPPSCFCYRPHCLLSVVPAPLKHRQPRMMAAAPRGQLRLNAVSVRVKPMYRLRERPRRCQTWH